MKYYVYIMVLILVPLSVQAAEGDMDRLCAAAASSSSAAYVPGVDVNGGSVSPADVSGNNEWSSGGQGPVSWPVEIPLTVNMAGRLGIALPDGVGGEGIIGLVTIDDNGHTLYNDRDISPEVGKVCGVLTK